MNILFRPTTPKDVAALPAIERAAGERFRDVPELAWLADGDVICAEQHLDYAKRGLSWLALANDSVHREWQGRGIGRRLIACVADHARTLGLTSLTLTTFCEVPWNAPFYARLGFETVTMLTPELRQKREEEAAHGFAYDSRCAMRLPL